jgi:hypothetical protein
VNLLGRATLEISLSDAVALRRFLRASFYGTLAFAFVASWSSLVISLIVLALLALASLVIRGSYHRPNRLRVIATLLLLSWTVSTGALLISGCRMIRPDNGHDLFDGLWALLSGGVFTWIYVKFAVPALRPIMLSQPTRIMQLAYSRSLKQWEYFRYILAHADQTSGDVLLEVAICVSAIGVTFTVVFLHAVLIPGLLLMRFLTLKLIKRLSHRVRLSESFPDLGGEYCVFLRSFTDDPLRFAEDDVFTVFRAFFGAFTLPRAQYLEEALIRTMWTVRPVIAVGMSDEDCAPMSAIRVLPPEQQWRAKVRELLASATSVFLLAGFSDGVKWEFQTLNDDRHLKKTAVLFPPEPGPDRERRWKALSGVSESGTMLSIPQTVALVYLDNETVLYLTANSNLQVTYELALRLLCLPAKLLSTIARPDSPVRTY